MGPPKAQAAQCEGLRASHGAHRPNVSGPRASHVTGPTASHVLGLTGPTAPSCWQAAQSDGPQGPSRSIAQTGLGGPPQGLYGGPPQARIRAAQSPSTGALRGPQGPSRPRAAQSPASQAPKPRASHVGPQGLTGHVNSGASGLDRGPQASWAHRPPREEGTHLLESHEGPQGPQRGGNAPPQGGNAPLQAQDRVRIVPAF
jgi:hypothetical protein